MAAAAVSAKLKLDVEGLSGALKDNVDARLSMIDDERIANTPYFKRYLESEIKKSLRALGYYNPIFDYSEPDDNRLVVNVDPGQPVLIEGVDVDITGEGCRRAM